ncbi:hypothetical protein HKCCE3408_10700 [Rhodobacterales bacterium HKCCE3408]|nr:hypothetical protein [Rhodobacterales bacterium HKCCE3408]
MMPNDVPDPDLPDILLVDDDLAEAKAVRQALTAAGITHPVLHLLRPEDALRLLRLDPGLAPDRVLLILAARVARRDGDRLMAALAGNPRLACVPVHILTGPEDSGAAVCPDGAGRLRLDRVGEDLRAVLPGLQARPRADEAALPVA